MKRTLELPEIFILCKCDQEKTGKTWIQNGFDKQGRKLPENLQEVKIQEVKTIVTQETNEK